MFDGLNLTMGFANDFFLQIVLVSTSAEIDSPAIVVKKYTESMRVMISFLKTMLTKVSGFLISRAVITDKDYIMK